MAAHTEEVFFLEEKKKEKKGDGIRTSRNLEITSIETRNSDCALADHRYGGTFADKPASAFGPRLAHLLYCSLPAAP